MKISFLLALIAFFSLSSCAIENSIDTMPVVTAKADPAPATPVNKTLMLKLVNAVRAKGCQCGDTYYNPAPPLLWDDRLEKAAFNHSTDMFQKNYFSHEAADGSHAGTRIEKEGYKWMAYGENIGMGYKNENQVVEGWLKSPAHCKNIMNVKYKEMGVSRVGNYWTQNFGTRLK